jgi:serine/threonine-protein kinase
MDQTISHYRLLHPLGAGGMGEVYAGFDDTLQRRVALKAIRAEHRLGAAAKARFLREARILSQLDHPGICRVYDFIETPDSDWLVLELIEGKTLQSAMAAGIEPGARAGIAQQIADVLVATHQAGVVHRDLKPGNVMLTAGGAVKVLDFGLAQSGEPAAETWAGPDGAHQQPAPFDPGATRLTGPWEHRTEAGVIMGTPAYMSPEQARGEPAMPASDLFSFGLILQELYTGAPARDPRAGPFQLIDQVRRGETQPLAGVAADIAALITALEAPAAADRPTAVDASVRLRWIRDKPKRRLRNLAVAAVVVAGIGGAAKYTIDLSRERTIAVVARDEADRRRTQAEDLIGFMLGDLRKKLEPVGRLDVLDGVGAKAMEYFAAVPASALSDEELLSRSTALYQIGEVRIAQGDLPAAAKPLQESLALAEALVARNPTDGDRLFNLAQSHYWVGFVHWRRHELDAAQAQFQAYLDAARRLVVLDSSRGAWQREIAYATSNIGSVMQARGDLAGALEQFRECLNVEQTLLARTPADAELASSAASSHNAIGLVLRLRGRLDEALQEFTAERAILERLVGDDPASAPLQRLLMVSDSYMGDLHMARGRIDAARARYAGALRIKRELAARDSSNRTWQRELAMGYFKVGASYLDEAPSRAAAPFERAVSILRTLTAGDPTNAAWQRDLAEVQHARGVMYAAMNDLPAAAADADASLAGCTRLLTSRPDDRQAARISSLAHALHARLAHDRGDAVEAAAAWGRALAVIMPAAHGSDDYLLLDPLAFALLETNRAQDASEILRKLDAMGYVNSRLRSAAQQTGLRLQARSAPHEGNED